MDVYRPCVCVLVERAQFWVLYPDQSLQSLGTKALLWEGHVTACGPPLSCDLSSGTGLRAFWELLSTSGTGSGCTHERQTEDVMMKFALWRSRRASTSRPSQRRVAVHHLSWTDSWVWRQVWSFFLGLLSQGLFVNRGSLS